MAKTKKHTSRMNRFFVEWSAINHFMSSYECEKNGIPYVGFSDPRVQKLWNGLSGPDRRDMMRLYGKRTEDELGEYLG